MFSAIFLVVGLLAQEQKPSMQWKNKTEDQTITLSIVCRDHNECASNQTKKLKAGQTSSVKVHVGRFQVKGKNQDGQTAHSNRKLVAGERDKMILATLYSGNDKKAKFKIANDDEEEGEGEKEKE